MTLYQGSILTLCIYLHPLQRQERVSRWQFIFSQLGLTLVVTMHNLHVCTKFEMSSFAHSRVTRRLNFFKGGNVTRNMSPLGAIIFCCLIVLNLCIKFEMSNFTYCRVSRGYKSLQRRHVAWVTPLRGNLSFIG